MSAFTGDTLGTYGAPYGNYSPVRDPTTDVDASCGNKWMAAVAGMTNTSYRAWAHITLNGSATPVLVAHAENWAPGTTAPTPAYSTTGTFTLTYPSTVSDEIPLGYAGYTGPTAINLRGGSGQVRFAGTFYQVSVVPTSANVATIYVLSSGSLANPGSATDFDVYLL